MIERYNPLYYKNGELMVKGFRPTVIGTPIISTSVIALALAFVVHPAWTVAFIPALLYLIFTCVWVDVESELELKEEFMLLRRKRVDAYLPTEIREIIYDTESLKDSDLKEKVLQYVGTLRDGYYRSGEVENYLLKMYQVVVENNRLEMEHGATGIIDKDLLQSKLETLRAKKEILEAQA